MNVISYINHMIEQTNYKVLVATRQGEIDKQRKGVLWQSTQKGRVNDPPFYF